MTRAQRAQVVELLRCTADDGNSGGLFGTSFGGGWPAKGEEALVRVHVLAVQARQEVEREHPWTLDYAETCLEAAARVEEGSWP